MPNREHLEARREVSNHPLEPLVTKSIQRLDRLFATERRSDLAQDARDLLSWWKEANELVALYTPDYSLAKRLASAFAQHNLAPLFEAHLTRDQFQRLTACFARHYYQIIDLIDRFSKGPGLETANSVVLSELRAAKDGSMRTTYSRVYVPGSRNR